MPVLGLGLLPSNVSTIKRLPAPVAPTTPKGDLVKPAPQRSIQDDPNLLAAIREVYSRLPEAYYREPWELQHILFSLGYTDDLADEVKIDAGIKIARTDWTPDEGAA
jgi:hypothetical protein